LTATPLGPGNEFDRIRAIATALGQAGSGLGDDCAFLPDGWCASTDVSNEGVHFRREWLSSREIGWRAAMAALSDLAAVAATPAGVLVALSTPSSEPIESLVELMAGVGAAAMACQSTVVGGDLSTGGALSLAVTVLGRAERPVRRVGARPGDGLWVTGMLGGARAALRSWQGGREPPPAARARFARPMARIREASWLASRGATAMIDLSDGLAGDAHHLARASGVGLAVDLEAIPVDPAVAGAEPWRDAAAGGEDYELLVTLPPTFAAGEQLVVETGTRLTRIGTVTTPPQVDFAWRGTPLTFAGYDHFR